MATGTTRRQRVPVAVVWFSAWLGLVALVGLWTAEGNVAVNFADRAASTAGIVTSKEPANHATIRATYVVNGVTYEASDSFIGAPNPSFNEVHVGDRVSVYYDPAGPATAVLSDPHKRSSNEFGFAILVAVLLPTGFVGALLLSLLIRSRVVRNGRR